MSNKGGDFKVQVVSNGTLTTVVADTGARVSVCGSQEAKQWNLLERMTPATAKIKPYNSSPIPVSGIAKCSVTFGATSIPVDWYILRGKCEQILSGEAAVQLGIISFTNNPEIFQPIHMINTQLPGNDKQQVQEILAKFPQNFKEALGKHNNYKVKYHVDPGVKPIVTPARPTPYHLKERLDNVLKEMIQNDVIEEHPTDEPAPWISAVVMVPKPGGGLRVTLDARNINKAIQSTNLPIPRQEDIKAQLSGSTVFSKLDFTHAFWQLEIHPESRYLTVFNVNDKLYRYKRLTMGVKPAQGELNTALRPLFAHIPKAHLIHDDLIIAAENMKEHNEALRAVLEAVSRANLTLQPAKCQFAMKELKFWGMTINSDGVKPDPEKVKALDHLESPKNKEELLSFICMMQSNAEFIQSFAQKSAPLRDLTKDKVRFRWTDAHEQTFRQLLTQFKEDALLRYFDISKPIYIITEHSPKETL